jgi:hypothetical protein
MPAKESSRTYDASRDATYAALERAVSRVGMKVEQTDPQRGVVAATTGVTIWSWGERVEASVAAVGTEAAVVTVTVGLKFQLFGWGQQQRVADGLLDEIQRELVRPTAPG